MTDYERIVTERMENIGANNGKPGSTAKCLQVREEMVWLAPHIEKLAPKTILEIGIYKGGWPYVLSPFFAEGAHIIGVDAMLRHRWEEGRLARYDLDSMAVRLRADGCIIDIIQGRSDDPAVIERAGWATGSRALDLLHIDGAHDYKSVLFDWKNWGPLVRTGGLTVLHDIGTRTSQMDVKRLWEEIVVEFPGRTHEIYVQNGIGVVEM